MILALLLGLVHVVSPVLAVTAAVITFVAAGDLGALLNNPQAWGLILGLLTPLLVSVVQQPRLPSAARACIAVASSAVVGLITCIVAGQIDAGDLLTTFAIVLVTSHTAYESFFKPTGVSPAVEAATSPVGKHVRQ